MRARVDVTFFSFLDASIISVSREISFSYEKQRMRQIYHQNYTNLLSFYVSDFAFSKINSK